MLNQSTIRIAGALFVLLVGLLGSMPHLATAQAQEDRFFLPQPTAFSCRSLPSPSRGKSRLA
jgi:hypothetical protein